MEASLLETWLGMPHVGVFVRRGGNHGVGGSSLLVGGSDGVRMVVVVVAVVMVVVFGLLLVFRLAAWRRGSMGARCLELSRKAQWCSR